MLVEVLYLISQWQHEFLLLNPDILSRNGSVLSALSGLPLKLVLSIWADQLQLTEHIMDADLGLVLVVSLLVVIDSLTILPIQILQLAVGIAFRAEVVVGELVPHATAHPREAASGRASLVVRQIVEHLEGISTIITVSLRLASLDVMGLIVTVVKEAHLLGVHRLVAGWLEDWIMQLRDWLVRRVLVHQIFVHGIELPLKIIDLLLLGVQLLSLLQDLAMLFLHFFQFVDGFIVDLLQLILIVSINLILQRKHINIIDRLLHPVSW